MAWFRSEHDPLIRRSREEEGHRQSVIRTVQPCASNLLCGHADSLNRRLGDLHAIEPLQLYLSRGCARPLTKVRMVARAKWLGCARILQIYVEVVHMSKCLILSIIMLILGHA